MSLARSLRFRLLTAALLSLLVVLGLVGIGLIFLFEKQVARRIEAEALTHWDQLVAAFTVDPTGQAELSRPLSDPRFTRPFSGLYWQIGRNGRPLQTSRSLWDVSLVLPDDGLQPGGLHRHDIEGPEGTRLLALEREVVLDLPASDTPYRLVVAIDERELTDVVGAYARDLILTLAALALVLLSASAVQIRYGLLPFEALRRALEELRGGSERRFGPLDRTDNFVAGDKGIRRHAPVVVQHAQIGMAESAEFNTYIDLFGTDF